MQDIYMSYDKRFLYSFVVISESKSGVPVHYNPDSAMAIYFMWY